MRNGGTMLLIYKEEILDSKPYSCRSHRQTTIDYWKRIYGKRISDCIIQINPDTDITAIKEDGTNLKYPQGIKRKAFDPYFKMRA